MCREFHRVIGEEGPSHTTLFRYAVGKVRQRNVLTERYVREAIDKVTHELIHQERSGTEAQREPQQEIRFRQLIENAKDLIFRYRRNPLACEYINPAVRDILGYTPEEFYADPGLILRIIHPQDRSKLESSLENPYQEKGTHRWIHKDGRVVWCEGMHVPIFDEAGNWVATEGVSRDVTKLRQTSTTA